jgi:hypothetical protein
LTDEEISILRSSTAELSQRIVSSRLGQQFTNPANLIAFMQSPEGQNALSETHTGLVEMHKKLQADKTLLLGLTMNRSTQQMSASNPFSGSLLAFLDQKQPPAKTVFSYFPADRALPMGEVIRASVRRRSHRFRSPPTDTESRFLLAQD